MKANQVYYSNSAVAADLNSPAFNFNGGRLVMGAFGALGGGTAKVQWSPDDPAGATWIDLGPQNTVVTTLAAAGTVAFYAPPGRYRLAFAGSAGPAAQVWIGDAETGT